MQENHGTYFVGRAELVGWINGVLGLNYQKIEQTHNGAAACQILDALHSGSVAFGKVNFSASTEYDMINNYKILQAGFNKLNVQKTIDVNKLIKGKPLDNIEFMQWLKSYYDRITAGQGISDYDGPGRRAHCKGGGPKRPSTGASNRPPTAASSRASTARVGTAPAPNPARQREADSAAPGGGRHNHLPSHGPAPEELDALNDRINTLSEDLSLTQHKKAEVESERDFYFSKLREIELLCQADGLKEQWPIMQAVENILYAATDSDGTQERISALAKYSNSRAL